VNIRSQMDDFYESGHSTALAGIPANYGHIVGKNARYYEMAYTAGYQAALAEIEQMRRAVAVRRGDTK